MNGKIDTWSTRPWEISTPKRVQRFTHSTIPLNGQITRCFEPCSKRLRTNSLELETDSSQDSNRTITQNQDKGRAQTKLSNWVRPHTHRLTTTLTKRSADTLMRDTHINSFHNSIHEDSNVRNGSNSSSSGSGSGSGSSSSSSGSNGGRGSINQESINTDTKRPRRKTTPKGKGHREDDKVT